MPLLFGEPTFTEDRDRFFAIMMTDPQKRTKTNLEILMQVSLAMTAFIHLPHL
jgi:hypothetical protein